MFLIHVYSRDNPSSLKVVLNLNKHVENNKQDKEPRHAHLALLKLQERKENPAVKKKLTGSFFLKYKPTFILLPQCVCAYV